MSEWPAIPKPLQESALAWRDAEDRLYPLAMSDADRYHTAVTLVGMLRPHFDRQARVLADLPGAASSAGAVLKMEASRNGIPLAGLSADDIVGAAAAARLRVLLTESEADVDAEAIEAARAAGLQWAVIREPGADAGTPGTSMVWVEVHIGTGARLVRSISMDTTSGAPLFTIELLVPGQAQPALRLDVTSRAEWIEESDELRNSFAQLETRPAD